MRASRRSKFEICADILAILASQGPLRPKVLATKCNLQYNVSRRYMEFLLEYNLVNLRQLERNNVEYSITADALPVLDCFGKLRSIIQARK